jgi:hypothetical protein
MVDTVVLSQSPDVRRCVWHRTVDQYGDGHVYNLEVELDDDGIAARGLSALDGRGSLDLPDFCGHLVERWRGWDGTLSWTSMEDEMSLDANHHGRHVL